MYQLRAQFNRPQLLVSVRNADEAHDALAGGANIIDVKEPLRGALGAADFSTVASVVNAVAGQATVTMALGELRELPQSIDTNSPTELPLGVDFFKIGFANSAADANWPDRWRATIDRLRGDAQPVAVVYADWGSAGAPSPPEVLAAAIAAECPAMLIDTWGKGFGSLFDHWAIDEVHQFTGCVREAGILAVLAGSLQGKSFEAAIGLCPDIVAVRGAACHAGRESKISRACVRALRTLIDGTRHPTRY